MARVKRLFPWFAGALIGSVCLAEALRYREAGHARGKVVITVEQNTRTEGLIPLSITKVPILLMCTIEQ